MTTTTTILVRNGACAGYIIDGSYGIIAYGGDNAICESCENCPWGNCRSIDLVCGWDEADKAAEEYISSATYVNDCNAIESILGL